MPHLHEKIDFTVETFIVHGNTVLLRKHDKYKIWLSVGGHIELDEDPNQAAVREVKEEVGLDVTLVGEKPPIKDDDSYCGLIPPRFMNRHKISDAHEHVTLIYFARTETNITTQNEKETSDGMHWFTKEELNDPAHEIKENVKYCAEQALQELSQI